MCQFDESRIGARGCADLQPPVAGDHLAGKHESRREARGSERFLSRDRDAADPQPAQSLLCGARPDPGQQRSQRSAAPLMLERETVPDVTLSLTRSDFKLQLADPLGLRGQPSVPCKLAAKPPSEAPAATRQPGFHQISIAAHCFGD